MGIISAGKQHLKAIRGIVDETWPVAYGDILTPAQIEYMINRFYSTDALAQQFDAGHQFLLYMKNGDALGFAGFEYNHEDDRIAKLHKLYVRPSTQGSGRGYRLLSSVINASRDAGQHKLTLNVNRYNKAISFYERSGFSIFKEEDIDIGEGYFMNDYVMELLL